MTGRRAHRTVVLTLDGLLAVHAVRGAWTALAAVPGLVSATVSLGLAGAGSAALELDGTTEWPALAPVVREALDAVGITVRDARVEPARRLPLG